MARRSLRHKLMQGLVLVTVSIGVLACGTAYGIYHYYTSNKVTLRKLNELEEVTRLLAVLSTFDQVGVPEDGERDVLIVANTRAHLDEFRRLHAYNVQAGLDPDGGDMERGLAAQLEQQLSALGSAVKKVSDKPDTTSERSTRIRSNPAVREPYERSRRVAEQLRQALIDDMLEYSRIGTLSSRFERVALDDVFDHALGLLDAPVREAGARVTRGALPIPVSLVPLVGGAVLVVSQFTLYGDTAKGRRPSWIAAARPEHAEPLVEAVVAQLRALGAEVQTLHRHMSDHDQSDYQGLQRFLEQIRAVEVETGDLEERWMELSDRIG